MAKISTKKFPSKNKMRELGFFNGHGIAEMTSLKLWIGFRPQDLGRGGHGAAYRVHRNGFNTYPKAAWYDYGSKTFNVFMESKEKTLQLALDWADKKYGKREWVRDPFGNYQDVTAWEAVMTRMKERVRRTSL